MIIVMNMKYEINIGSPTFRELLCNLESDGWGMFFIVKIHNQQQKPTISMIECSRREGYRLQGV